MSKVVDYNKRSGKLSTCNIRLCNHQMVAQLQVWLLCFIMWVYQYTNSLCFVSNYFVAASCAIELWHIGCNGEALIRMSISPNGYLFVLPLKQNPCSFRVLIILRKNMLKKFMERFCIRSLEIEKFHRKLLLVQ